MSKIRGAVIGVGGMGYGHAKAIQKVPQAELVAVCDIVPQIAEKVAGECQCRAFTDHNEMFQAGLDMVIISTPHASHTPIAIDALKSGVHVLCEKPLAVHVLDGRKMLQAWKDRRQKFGVMFQNRLLPAHQKVKQIVDDELGTLMRGLWIATDWFRTQAYFDSAEWRGTWRGEGGGVLLNQAIHQVDMYGWLMGHPNRIWCRGSFGKYHQIEVEDEVTAIWEYDDGRTAVFVASTGECPGTNRLEIAGDRGKVVLENRQVKLYRTNDSVADFRQSCPDMFTTMQVEQIDVPCEPGNPDLRDDMVAAFCQAILDDTEPPVPADEGIKSLELVNAMIVSALSGRTVRLPLTKRSMAPLLRKLGVD